jgi:ribose transport system ATP-binding protein
MDSTGASSVTAPALRLQGLSKRFGGVRALDDVSFDVVQGEVHGLVGLNGSGKSTLIKILARYYSLDAGDVVVPAADGGTRPATADDMAFVHQDLGLIASLSVVENLALGRRRRTSGGRIDTKAERARARKVLARFGLEDKCDLTLGRLTRAEATIVAMARALERQREADVRILVLDEPTSALPKEQSESLLKAMREVTADGTSVIFVSHRMAEIHGACDSVTALRNGRLAWSGSIGDITPAGLLDVMIGSRDVAELSPESASHTNDRPLGRAVVLVSDVSDLVLDRVSLDLHPGEVVGVTGLLGSGVEELGLVVAGRAKPLSGSVRLHDRPLGPGDARLRTTVGLVPGDRLGHGVVGSLPVRENISLPAVGRHVRRGMVNRRREDAHARSWITDLQVKAPGPGTRIGQLSGGNQQKCVLARWLGIDVDVLVAVEPTQGIDVHAKREVLGAFERAAQDGMAVALFSHDPDEIFAFCDRVLVLAEGRIAMDVRKTDTSIGEVLRVMSAATTEAKS